MFAFLVASVMGAASSLAASAKPPVQTETEKPPVKPASDGWLIGIVLFEALVVSAMIGAFLFAVLRIAFALHGQKFP